MRRAQSPAPLALAFAFSACLTPSLLVAQATTATPGVDRLNPLPIDQTDVTNATGANVYQRLVLDHAVEHAGKTAAGQIDTKCGDSRVVIMADGGSQGPNSILAARAAQKSALLELERINTDIVELTQQLEAFPPQTALTPFTAPAGPERIAPGMIDLVRVVDSIRFLTSLVRTNYTFTAATGISPTPGLLEITLLSGKDGKDRYRLGEPLSTTSAVLTAYDVADKSYKDLESAYAVASTKATKETADALAALKKAAELVRSQLFRYITAGANNAPSPLQQLSASDFVLPKTTDCLVTYGATVDATTITTQRAVFPSRKFDIDARVRIITAIYPPSGDAKQSPAGDAEQSPAAPKRQHSTATCTLTVDPKKRSEAKPKCGV